MSDYLHIGGQIVNRLAAAIPALVTVGMAASPEEAVGMPAATPSALVVWGGDHVSDMAGDGERSAIDQHWVVFLSVRSTVQHDTGAGLVKTAGPLLSEILSALSGWRPEAARGLRRISAPAPISAPGIGFFPLAFSARLIV